MKKLILALAIISLAINTFGQNIESIDKDGLLKLIHKNNDTTYVINFWATWCSPCVAEIGFFEEVHQVKKDAKVDVILINLDFPNQVNSRVLPFIEKHGLSAKILNMTDMDYNNWIPSIDENWSGTIPATYIFKGNYSKFIPNELSQEELFEEVDRITNI